MKTGKNNCFFCQKDLYWDSYLLWGKHEPRISGSWKKTKRNQTKNKTKNKTKKQNKNKKHNKTKKILHVLFELWNIKMNFIKKKE